MKVRSTVLVVLALVSTLAHAQVPTLINYQGKLINGTNLVNADVGMNLRLYNDPSAGALLYEDSNTVTVVDGLYSTLLGDGTIFGTLTNALTSPSVYIEVAVNGVTLSPRETLASAGYAILAADVPGNVFWRTAGNTGTSSSASFVGTRDNRMLNFRVNNQVALRLVPDATAPSIIGGHAANTNNSGNAGAVIAGGGQDSEPHNITANSSFATIGGGAGNQIGNGGILCTYSTIAGGESNYTRSVGTTVGGGQRNAASGLNTTVGGGFHNSADGRGATIAGGEHNNASNNNATVGGGKYNQANGSYSTIPGGYWNYVTGAYCFAAGQHAEAVHDGSFVWADAASSDFFWTTATNQFLIRAQGGVGINTNGPFTDGLTVDGGIRASEAVHAESFVGDGSGLTMLNGSNVAPGTIGGDKIRNSTISNGNVAANTFWGTQGNTGTTGGVHFIGTADYRPLEVRVNSNRALRIETRGGTPNLIGGYEANTARTASIEGAVIAGGGDTNGLENTVSESYSAVGGGAANIAGDTNGLDSDSMFVTVAGGFHNKAQAEYAGIAGGVANTIEGNARGGFIGGGTNNSIRASSHFAVIGGGQDNATAENNSFIGGGLKNVTTNYYSVITGGKENTNAAYLGFIGGGLQNFAASNYALVVGGAFNDAVGTFSFIGNGLANEVSPAAEGGVVAGGRYNTAGGSASAIVGGGWNTVTSEYSFVGGGSNNAAMHRYAVVVGGASNIAGYVGSFVGGGVRNVADDWESVVVGGFGNTASGSYAAVVGGELNKALTNVAFVGGGLNNTAGAIGASVVGGRENSGFGDCSAIGGGYDNRASGTQSTIGGGSNNTIESSATVGVVGGGMLNQLAGVASLIGGGFSNLITSGGDYSCIGGGRGNATKSDFDVIGGGDDNDIDSLGNYSVIGGGLRNLMTNYAHGSVIGGGYDNTVTGRWAVLAGGRSNVVGGDYSVVLGGSNNAAFGESSLAAGYRAKANHDSAFVWADGQGADFASTTNNQFAIRASNGVWVADNAGGSRTVQFGERFRDNGIIAWARVAADGSWSSDSTLNVTNVAYNGAGSYRVYVGDSAANMLALLPVVVAEVDSQPSNAASLRIVSVNQIGVNYFDVWVNNGSGIATNNDFLFMVTGR